MQLGIVALLCALILAATGAGGSVCRSLGIRTPYAMLYLLLMLLLSGLEFRVSGEFSFHPAAVLTAVLLGVYCCRNTGMRGLSYGLALAFAGGLALRFAGSLPTREPGLIYALAVLPVSVILYEQPPAALFTAAAAPLFLAFWEAALELYAFGYTVVRWGAGSAFDAQMIALLLCALLLFAIRRSRVRQTDRM